MSNTDTSYEGLLSESMTIMEKLIPFVLAQPKHMKSRELTLLRLDALDEIRGFCKKVIRYERAQSELLMDDISKSIQKMCHE